MWKSQLETDGYTFATFKADIGCDADLLRNLQEVKSVLDDEILESHPTPNQQLL